MDETRYVDADALLANNDLASAPVSNRPPMIDKQTKRIRLGEIRAAEDRSWPDRHWLVVPFQLEETAVDTDGNELPVGRQLKHEILITPKGGLTQAMINERLAKLQVAGTGAKKAVNGFSFGSLSGKTVVAKFSVRSSKTDASKLFQEVDFYADKASNGGAA